LGTGERWDLVKSGLLPVNRDASIFRDDARQRLI
jgi:hypothetical protein